MALVETQSSRIRNQVAAIDATCNNQSAFTALTARLKQSHGHMVEIEKYLNRADKTLQEMKCIVATRLPKKWNAIPFQNATRDYHLPRPWNHFPAENTMRGYRLQFYQVCMLVYHVYTYILLASKNRTCRSHLEMAENCMDNMRANISGSGDAARVLSPNGIVNKLGKLQDGKRRDIKTHQKKCQKLGLDRIYVQEKVTSNLTNFIIQHIFSKTACFSFVVMVMLYIAMVIIVPIENLAVLFERSLSVFQLTKIQCKSGMILVILAMLPFVSVNLTSKDQQLSLIENPPDMHAVVGEMGTGQLIFCSLVMSSYFTYVIRNKGVLNIDANIKLKYIFTVVYSMIIAILSLTYYLCSDVKEAVWVTMCIAFTIIIWFECSGWFTKLELVILVTVYLIIDTASIFGITVLAFITLFLWIQLAAHLVGIIDI